MRQRKYSPIGALCLVLVGSMASCARPAGLDEARVPGIAANLDSVSQLIAGSPRQRLAGEVIAYHAYQDPIRQCIAHAGFSYTPPTFVNPYAGMTVIHMGTGDEEWFAPLQTDTLGVGAGIQRVAGHDQLSANPGYTNLDAAGRERYNAALGVLPGDVGCVTTRSDGP